MDDLLALYGAVLSTILAVGAAYSRWKNHRPDLRLEGQVTLMFRSADEFTTLAQALQSSAPANVPLDCGWEIRGTVRNYGRSQIFIQSALVGQGSIFGLFPPKRDDVSLPRALATGERLDFLHSGDQPMGLDLHQPVVFQVETGDGTRFTRDIGGRGSLGFGLTDDSLAPAFYGGTPEAPVSVEGPLMVLMAKLVSQGAVETSPTRRTPPGGGPLRRLRTAARRRASRRPARRGP